MLGLLWKDWKDGGYHEPLFRIAGERGKVPVGGGDVFMGLSAPLGKWHRLPISYYS